MENLEQVNRFEVVDLFGRAYTAYDVEVALSFQDDGQTLKVFVKPRAEVTVPEKH